MTLKTPMTGNTLKVLLIEDDEDDYILTCGVFAEVSGTKYSITWISKYSEAMAALIAGEQDVCLIDYRLGEGNGIDLMREATAAGCRIPMILLTGQGDREIDIEATEAGAEDYLTKGQLDAPLLERAVRYAIAHGRTLETLRGSEERFRSLIESANDAIVLTDQHGMICSWNKSAETIYGYSGEEITGRPLSTLFPATYYKNMADDGQTDPMIASRMLHANSKAIELIGLRKDGREFPLEVSISTWQTAEGSFYSGIIRDVTDRKALEDQLTHQALHDPLTKLANRVLFSNRVEHAMSRVSRENSSVSVLFLDLDNFKNVNDTMGHAAGDELLVSVAERLQLGLRSSDTAARLGGDEFAILVEDAFGASDAVQMAERIMEFLRAPFRIGGKDLVIGTSIGIATVDSSCTTPEELLRNADVAMYIAKSGGKARFAVFENQMHEALVERVALEAEMRIGIGRHEFELHYQPIVDLETGGMMGMEALCRWHHPMRGLISPLEFIPIAEESNLIFPLGQWILNEACRQTRLWHAQFDCASWLSITVNISSCQFQDDSMIDTVSNALSVSGLRPESLILEITENTMLRNSQDSLKKLHDLKDLGVRLAIDDFGTGYSSLSYLQQFPIDILKIDKSFVDRINMGDEGAAVAKAIITMSDTLHLRTIAEGIETSEQRITLQGLGCELGQGYRFARPLPKGEMDDFLQKANIANRDRILPGQLPQIIQTIDDASHLIS